MQEKNDKRLQNCFGSEGAFRDTAKPSDPGDERPQKVQNSRLERVDRIQYLWEVNGWDLVQVWERGGLNFGPRMFFSKPRSAPDNTPFVRPSFKP